MKRCFLLFATLCLLISPVAAAGDDSWVEVKSPHFSVITDGGEKRGREVALRFEQMRAVFGAMMSAKAVSTPVPVQILAFKNRKEMRLVSPLFNGKPVELAGLYQGSEDEDFIALDLSSEENWRTVFHEYAHLLLHSNIQSLPPWFDEGFAEYYSTIKVDGKVVDIGMPPENDGDFLTQNSRMPTDLLLAVEHDSKVYNESGNRRSMFYAQSWLTVHYIFDKKLVRNAIQYFDLTVVQKKPFAESFQKAFGMSTKEFDKALGNYLMGNTVLYGKLPTPPIESTGYTSVPLPGIDAEVAIADMHFHSRDYSNKASAEYEAILKRQPDNVRANRGLGYARMMHGDIEAAEPYLARAAAADQKDPMVHYYYAMLLARRLGDEEGVREKILAQAQIATRLNPELADAYNLMAVMYSHEHQFDQAEEALSKAIKLKPQDDNYKANLAGFYMQQEKFDEAKALLAKLQSSSNPSIAIMAQRNLEAIDREKESNSALLVRTVESSDRAAEKPILRESGVRTAPAREPQPEEESPAAPPPPKEPPVAYVRGMLTSSVCGSPEATLTVVTDRKKTLKLRTQDWKKMVVFGADQFSCEWKNKRISVNYRPLSGPDADGAIVGMSLLE